MAGHSKWATTKHRKMAVDAKRGKLFTKLIKEITVAARLGGGDPDGNPRLRTAIVRARESNMPSDNIKKAIQRGTGELPGTHYEETVLEGYGPGGVAILIYVMTDNKNRTVPEIRYILNKYGGSIGEAGCVSWMFEKKGYIVVEGEDLEEDSLMSLALDAGAEDMRKDDDNYEIITSPGDFEVVKKAIEEAGYPVALSEVTMLPRNYIDLDSTSAERILKLMEALEDHDDVQNVYSNFNIDTEILQESR